MNYMHINIEFIPCLVRLYKNRHVSIHIHYLSAKNQIVLQSFEDNSTLT